MTKETLDPAFWEAYEDFVARYPETMRYLAEMERLEREGHTEQEAAGILLAKARPRTS